ncbi:helix-turn-helix domain-containing protein [Anaerosinus massiliensis]|uniref:helix-turn-helix domain-containing protein n=1 Tax=Massilibacillus massiliensis TaxID=1806837 RepID=UPI000A86B4A1|nr:AraC family transcriptional regulator [Massilibacillus massiliensis]
MTQKQYDSFYSNDMKIIQQSDDCTIYAMDSSKTIGTITSYNVFPGIQLTYNDFHTDRCPNHHFSSKNMIEINHCREGRFECEFVNGMYTYLGAGDLAVNTLENNCVTEATFPLSHYHGVSILIDLETADKMVSTVLTDISIDLYHLQNKLCANNTCFIIRAKDSIEHIFSELYTIPDEVKYGYFKLKILELLLFLSIIDTSEQFEKRPYFPKNQVNKVKQIKHFLTQNLEEHFTLEELSNRFTISPTAMKACFKAVYGMPIYTYLRTYRMQTAASMLLRSQDSITIIAGNVGYENPSKFSSAFKSVMHASPSAYRQSN